MMDEGILHMIATATPVNTEQQIKTLNYFEELKHSETGWQICVQALSSKTYSSQEVQFFCFQVIEHFVKTRYLMSSFEHQTILRDFMCNWSRLQIIPPSAFLRNKVAQIIALLFIQDYPLRWPNFFNTLLSALDSSDDGASAVDQYLRILDAIDTEIADRDIPRNPQELQRNNTIKDAMREKVISDLVDSWYKILTAFEQQNPIVTCHCLQIVGKYILWIDINLVANDRFVPILVKHLSDFNLREAAADCIFEIISKGMDPIFKTKLIESFSTVLSNVGAWRALQDGSDSEYVAKLGRIAMAMGSNLIESYRKMSRQYGSQTDMCQAVSQALEGKIPLVLEFFSNDYDDVSASVLNFIREYLHLLKSQQTITDVQNKFLVRMLEIVTKKFRFDEDYDFDKDGEDEAEFLDFRKQLKVVFENIGMLNKHLVTAHVQNLVTATIHNWRKLPFEDIEVSLLLMYYLGEAVPISGICSFSVDPVKTSPIQTLLLLLLNSDLHLHLHRAVILQYFETLVRYDKFFVCHTDYIGRALSTFSKHGLFHPDKKVRSRCAYLFCRFIKCVRNHITIQLGTDIIQAIHPLLAMENPSKNFPSDPLMSADDQLYLYEVVGVVIIAGERSNEKTDLMKRVVTPLLDTCRTITDQFNLEKDPQRIEDLANVMIQAISVTGRLSKAFSNQQSMKTFGCVPLFLDALTIFLYSVEVSSGEQQQELQSCVRQYLHRMVVCLEEELLPYIPGASQVLLKNCDSKSIQEYIPLINQVICKFKLSWIFQKEVVPFLKQMFTPMVQCVFKTLSEPIEENDQIAIHDRQLLQRQYFNFIATIVTNNINDVLSAEENSQVLEQVMLSVIQGSVEFPDPVAQKSCFSILRAFVNLWGGQDNPVGFIDFMYKNIVPACFMAPCKPSFDINDAQTLFLLNEIASCLKTIFEKRAEEFIVYLQTHYLPTLDLPAPKIQEFLQALQAPGKDFKPYLKVFFRQVKS